MSVNYTPNDIQAFVNSLYTIQPGQRAPLLVPFAYPVVFTALAQGATQTAMLGITANADFLHLETRYHAQIGAAQNIGNKTVAFARLLVTDSGTNEQWSNSPVDLENFCTNGYAECSTYFPRLVQGRTSLTVQVTNYAPTAETYTTLELLFAGVLIKTW